MEVGLIVWLKWNGNIYVIRYEQGALSLAFVDVVDVNVSPKEIKLCSQFQYSWIYWNLFKLQFEKILYYNFMTKNGNITKRYPPWQWTPSYNDIAIDV